MNLLEKRKQIDNIDTQISALFKERLEVSEQIAKIKKGENLPILSSAREREIISRLTQGQNDVHAAYTKLLYTTIFDISRACQNRIINTNSKISDKIRDALETTPKLLCKSAVVACQGTEGANSTAACEKLFNRPSVMYFNTFEGVFTAVEKGLCQYGVLPIENSLHGSVNNVYDLMSRNNFYIAKSIKLKINHTLMAKPGATLDKIKTIYSHEQALAQCSNFIKGLNVDIIQCENTATAAKIVSNLDSDEVAAISSASCAELYNLEILSNEVQNSDNNYTRFILISKNLEIYPDARKISLMMTLPHKPGSLYHLMSSFAALDINLTKLESRPLPDSDFEFMFYFDLDISVYDEAVLDLFAGLENTSEQFCFLGCYNEL